MFWNLCWSMKFKFPNLLNPLGNIILQNDWSFYSSELIYFANFNMRHPVAGFLIASFWCFYLFNLCIFWLVGLMQCTKVTERYKDPQLTCFTKVDWTKTVCSVILNTSKILLCFERCREFLAMFGLYLILLNKQFWFNPWIIQ